MDGSCYRMICFQPSHQNALTNIMNTSPYNVDQLIDYSTRKKCKYLFFWGHKQRTSEVTKTCLSQWYPSSFHHRPGDKSSDRYATSEHYMMAQKAILFGAVNIAKRILADDDPAHAKALGRQVPNFKSEVWDAEKFYVVVRANELKFGQNPDLRNYLLSTGKRILVEASPADTIWGIGLAQDHPDASNPKRWKGENLLGFALMKVRDNLRRQQPEN